MKHRIRNILTIAAGAVLFTACGGSSDDGSGLTDGTSGSEPAPITIQEPRLQNDPALATHAWVNRVRIAPRLDSLL
jgi:hypothetical protein